MRARPDQAAVSTHLQPAESGVNPAFDFALRNLQTFPIFIIVVIVSVVAFMCEARWHKRRAGSLILLASLLLVLLIIIAHNPVDSLWRPFVFLLAPASIAALGACRWPEEVPPRDVGFVVAFFVLVTAAALHQTTTFWYSTGGALPLAGLEPLHVRRATMSISTGAIGGHALTIALRRCEGFWSVTRVAIAFAGLLRLASAALLRHLGAEGACYPPAQLEFRASLLVCSSYLVLAIVLTRGTRLALAAAFRQLLGWLGIVLAAPANGTAPAADEQQPPQHDMVRIRGGGVVVAA